MKMLKPIIIIFVVFVTFIIVGNNLLVKYSVNKNVLLSANVLFLITGVFVFFMQKKALTNSNPNVFIRSVIAGMMIKMFSTVIAVLSYVLIEGSGYNKKAVFLSLLMYLVYLATEVFAISKQLKKK